MRGFGGEGVRVLEEVSLKSLQGFGVCGSRVQRSGFRVLLSIHKAFCIAFCTCLCWLFCFPVSLRFGLCCLVLLGS